MCRFALAILMALALVFSTEAQEKTDPGRGYKPLTPEQRKMYQALSNSKHGNRLAMMAANQTLPSAFDCRTKVPLPIWDQGSCGSCYLISTVRTATCSYIIAGYGKADGSFMLSCQFGMDRPRDFGECQGGNGTEVIDWMCKNGWPAEVYVDQQGVIHKDYPPYEARPGNDRTKPGAKMWMKGADWGIVGANGSPSIAEIKAAMANYGRLNIALDAGGQFSNGTKTITSLGTSINHEINAAAYDDNHDNGDGTKGAVLLENQWNTSWGTGGYRWCSYNASRRIVDWFFVTTSPLPPPPPPPPPPGPEPVTKAQMLLRIPGMPDQVFDVQVPSGAVPANLSPIIKDLQAKLIELQAAIDASQKLNKPGLEAPFEKIPLPLPKGEPEKKKATLRIISSPMATIHIDGKEWLGKRVVSVEVFEPTGTYYLVWSTVGKKMTPLTARVKEGDDVTLDFTKLVPDVMLTSDKRIGDLERNQTKILTAVDALLLEAVADKSAAYSTKP